MTETTEIVPSLELTGIEKTLGDVEQLTRQLAPLSEKARTLKVTYPDREAYNAIGEVLSQERLLRKQGEAAYAPFNLIVDRVKTFLRTKLQKHTTACEEIDMVCRLKMKTFEHDELKAAEAEQAEINKKRERKGEEPITVKPEIPSVAGYRRSTNYRVEVIDAEKLLKAWQTTDNLKLRRYLRQFITINTKALADAAKDLKDPEKFMKLVPGVRCWKD